VDCVDFQFWGEQEPTFFEPWEKVHSAKLDRKQTKTDLAADQEEGWLGEASEKRLDVSLMLRYVTSYHESFTLTSKMFHPGNSYLLSFSSFPNGLDTYASQRKHHYPRPGQN
jgi:hypothetical protein